MITKEQVIHYFMSLKDDLVLSIDDTLYTDLNNSLTFKQLQDIDHKRQDINTIYKIIEFLQKETI